MEIMHSRRAFTRVEILIIIIVTLLFAALVYPIIGAARDNSSRNTCVKNQQQIAVSLLTFVQDHDYTFPVKAAAPMIWSGIWRLPEHSAVTNCPRARRHSVMAAVNIHATG